MTTIETSVRPETLQAALRRDGVWLVDAVTNLPTDFYHKSCFKLTQRPAPRPELAVWACQLDRDTFAIFMNPLVRATHMYNERRNRLDFGR